MTERLNAIVGARIGEFRRKMAEARAIAAAFPKKIVTSVQMVGNDLSPKVDSFRKRMDKLADAYRDMNVIAGEAMWGGLVTALPMLVALVPGLTAVIATLGVQIGIVAGGAMGLASSLSLFGAAAVGMGVFMAPLVKDLSEAHKAIQNGDKSLSDYSGTMREALTQLTSLKEQFNQTKEAMAPDLYGAMAQGMASLRVVIDRVTSGLVGTAEAARGLMDSLYEAINSGPDIQKTFDWFNTRGPEAFRNWGEIAGWAIRGVLNLMRAFDPLAKSMEQGLLNMTKRFSEWADGLGESKKFQEFIEYVKTNGPVLLDTIGNIVMGFVNMFAAFAPLSADMMKGFQDMTQRFEEWSAKLSENEGFKTFVNYIRENGPQMIDLIGNLTTFLIELGKGFAHVGEWLMPIANGFLEWANSLMQTNPNIARSVAVMFTLFGVFKAIAPMVIGAVSLFGNFFTRLITGFATMVPTVGAWLSILFTQLRRIPGVLVDVIFNFMARLGGFLVRGLAWAARFAQVWLRMMGPWGWVISIVLLIVGVIVKNWDKIKQWTIQTFAKVYTWMKQKWEQAKAITQAVATAIWNYVKQKFTETYNSVKSKMQEIKSNIQQKWQEAKETVRNKVQEIWSNIKEKFEQIKSTVEEKIEAAKEAVRNKFEEMREAVSEKLEAAKGVVEDGLDAVKSIFDNFSLYDSGKAIIQSAIDGITSMTDKITGAVSTVAGKVRDFWPFSPAKEGPLSDIHKMDFGGPVTRSINNMKPQVNRAMQKAMGGLRSTMEMGNVIGPSVKPVTNVSNFAPEIPTDYEREDNVYVFNVDGRELAQAERKHHKDLDKVDNTLQVALDKLSAR
ncbi:phage tail protein [Halobacillus karajensis]|uniref:Phage-related protein n=1 Tax=Halobacillus karajensis TaxID=195088 RepID=A0A059NW88_9BACI|nr:hypothetical protein [Halobacillus karajensis]CDQ22568.1 Phage-related protein [Halobacillus karajensis]CDQ26050.1 Phage-related protein [Halobacillus karajensis]